jgi:hypothetical protein
MAESRTCPRCSTEFEPRRKNQFYCSRECKDRAHSAAQRARNEKRPCKVEGCERPALDKLHCGMHYRRLRLSGDVGSAESTRGGVCSVEGCERPHYSNRLCNMHYIRLKTKGEVGSPNSTKRANGQGTIAIVGGYRRLQWYENGKRRAVAEHRQVMEQVLGRPLESFESVHHRNGRRADNRPANLELWTKPQPCGQRPEDLVAWANEHYTTASAADLIARCPDLLSKLLVEHYPDLVAVTLAAWKDKT